MTVPIPASGEFIWQTEAVDKGLLSRPACGTVTERGVQHAYTRLAESES
jgi:hypothetical protein